MSSPTKPEEEFRYIQEVVNGVKNIKKRLVRDVEKMCELLCHLFEKYSDKMIDHEATTRHLRDIYWSLELHLSFHLQPGAERRLPEFDRLGGLLKLTDKEYNSGIPKEECAIDPGSKFLEIVSIHLISRMKKDFFEPSFDFNFSTTIIYVSAISLIHQHAYSNRIGFAAFPPYLHSLIHISRCSWSTCSCQRPFAAPVSHQNCSAAVKTSEKVGWS